MRTSRKEGRCRVPQEVQGLLDLVQIIYLDACTECAVNPDPRDVETIRRRVEDEGLSFLTITLPTYCRDFERSLANRRIDSNLFHGFRKRRAIPAFLQGMLNLIFDGRTGELHDSPRATSVDICSVVAAIRQVCRCFNKLQATCSPERESEALEGFSSIEQFLAASKVPEADEHDFIRACRLIWDPIFGDFSLQELIPTHGPGATADGIRGNSKYRWQYWHERLEPYFPFLGFAYPLGFACSFSDEALGGPSGTSLEEEFETIPFVSPESELPSRVIAVPKTLKGPRIIAAEPIAAQYAQQSLRSYLYGKIESHSLTGGRINFRDQSINQRLALISSASGEFATLDLSDASDRVLNSLAMRMFDGSPILRDAIQACRTTHAKLPDGRLVGPLEKFASMGSALCFPVEAMYFYTICVIALLKKLDLPFDHRSVYRVGSMIRVYGDDLIVPTDAAATVCDHLHQYMCKVNVHKSFWTGKFRESCGTDAYDGRVVTPTYVRHFIPTNRRQHTEIISVSATANAFYLRGYWHTAQHLWNKLEVLLGALPVVSSDSPAVGRISVLPGVSVGRWSNTLHRFEVKAWVVEPVYQPDTLESYAALAKSLLSLERREQSRSDQNEKQAQVEWDWRKRLVASETDPAHLERVARHGVATLKRRWVRAT